MLKSLFSEASDISMMRVSTFLLVLDGCGVSLWGLVRDKPLSEVAMLAGTAWGIALGGKAAQKFAERKAE